MSESPRRPRRPSYLSGPMGPRTSPGGDVRPPDDSGEKEKPVQEEVEDRELFSWSVWLLPRRPVVSVIVVCILLLCIYLAYWAFPEILFVGLITLILINRLAPYLFPVRYFVSEQKVGYKTFLAADSRPWEKFFTYYKFNDGVLLSHDTRTVRGRVREGLFLYYGKDTPVEEVLQVIGSKLPSPKEAMKESDDNKYTGGLGSALRRVRRLKDK